MLHFKLNDDRKVEKADCEIDMLGDYVGTFSHRMKLDQELEYSPFCAVLTESQKKAKAEAESFWDSAMPGLRW